ncbi:alpha/beta fold hydrolase [Arthrobacter sp. KBS0703]|uniref:alpha/beta fold hydrolase n=1 Tax=Arthrobacter sp. KBS0703 TaxID=1955698 RepID=UPI0021B0E599|nr:hypothetical protein [Arthrobacter sp. KBS0703]
MLLGFIDSTVGDEPFLVIGHSYGGYLARAIANRRADQAVGLALICPVGAHTRDVPQPVLVLAGRQDATAGHTGPWELVEHYPRATFAVLDSAGHALLHEQPDLVQALFAEWLTRVRERF